MDAFWLWVVGTALFMPLFLPFYILRRPRPAFFRCPDCNWRNRLPTEECRNCGLETSDLSEVSVRGEWSLSDAIAIYTLAVFTLPMSVMGLFAALGLVKWKSTGWSSLFILSLMGSTLLVGLPLWFIIRVCRRPLSDLGLPGKNLPANILLGFALVIPVMTVGHFAEEVIVRASITAVPSQADAIRDIQSEEHRRGSEIWPESSQELGKLLGAALMIVVLAPVGEELLFRGIAYSALRRRGKWRAAVVSSLLFAVAHMQVVHFFPIFVMGFAFAFLVERTRSLVPAIVLHLGVNLALLILWYYNPGLYT